MIRLKQFFQKISRLIQKVPVLSGIMLVFLLSGISLAETDIIEGSIFSLWNRTDFKAVVADTPEEWAGPVPDELTDTTCVINIYTQEALHGLDCRRWNTNSDLLFLGGDNRIRYIMENCSNQAEIICPEPVIAILRLPAGFVQKHALELTHFVNYPRTTLTMKSTSDIEIQRTQSIKRLTHQLNEKPHCESCRINLAAHLVENADFTEAEQIITHQQEWITDPVQAITLQAKAIALQGKFSEALQLFERALDHAPEKMTTVIFIERTLKISRSRDQSISAFKTLLNKHPHNIYLVTSLCQIYLDSCQFDHALELITDTLNKLPNNPELLKYLGHVHLRLGSHRKAAEAYRQYLISKPFDPHIRDISSFVTVHIYRDDILKKEISQ